MRSGLAIPTLGLLLAGCGGGSGTAGNAVSATATDPMEANIAALTGPQRKLTFYKAIYDADYQCGEIVTVESKPRDEGRPVWLATCEDKGEYVITLQPRGIFTVSGVQQPKRRLPIGTKILPAGTK